MLKPTLITLSILLYASSKINFENSKVCQHLKPPSTVPSIDLNKYLGVWYQQAVIPYYFQFGCSKTKATYSLNDKGNIKVDNICERKGIRTQSIGEAVPQDSTNTKLRVTFPQAFGIVGQYWIVRIGQDYEFAVVSSPDYANLWILARDKQLDLQTYGKIIQDLRKDGFPVQKLIKTQQ